MFFVGLRKIGAKGGETVRREEKETPNWEVKDPKVPVVQSGRLEDRARNDKVM